jgi:hypothetical protein
MKKMNLWKEASVLLIAVFLVFSTIAVTANTYDLRQDAKSVGKATEQQSSDFDRSTKTGIIGQGQIFYEDFDTGAWPSEGFPIIDSDFGSPETWVLGTYDFHTSPYSAEVWWAWPPPCQSEWLISKNITLPAGAELEFYSYVYLGSIEGDEYKVKISPNGSTHHDDFITLWDATNDFPPDTGWHYFTDPSFTIDLSEYGPGTVRIAFHADGSPSVDCALWYIWLVDTVSITVAAVPDLDCEGELSWEDVTPGDTVEGSFTVENIGDPESELDWEIAEYPEWGNWTFDPISGVDLTPEAGPVTVDVEVVAPDEENAEFEGEITIVNLEDPDDTCTIPVSLKTPVVSPFVQILRIIIQRFPILGQILYLFL